jgi:diacylglycerol kinase (ATP)
LFNPFQKETGLKTALELTKTCKNVNLIICGGDGTVLWVVSAAINAGINLDDVCFGIIPIGTGNDFSRSLGWGGSPISFSSEDIRQLRKTVQKWVKASKQKFDLWDVSISTFEGGKITPSSSNVEQEETKTELSKTFSNYVGIGIDARVSYHF